MRGSARDAELVVEVVRGGGRDWGREAPRLWTLLLNWRFTEENGNAIVLMR